MKTHIILVDSFAEYLRTIKRTKSVSTYKNTAMVLNKLKLIEQKLEKPFLIPIQKGSAIAELKRHEAFWKKFEKHLKTDFLKHNYLDSYIKFIFKIINAFLSWIIHVKYYKIIGFHALFKVKLIYNPIITLDESKWFELLHCEQNLIMTPAQVKTKDLFLFGCITGLRYSDLSNLNKSNLEIHNENTVYLIKISQKTQTTTSLKLPPIALEIIKKYRRSKNKLLPYPSLNHFNLLLKELGETLGWTYEVGKTRYKNEKSVEVKTKLGKRYRFCDLLSSHIMRKTAITTLLLNGMPEHLVRQISGHSPNSSEFYRYVNYYQSYIDDHTDLIFEKILKQ